jgi:hypothetical protein
MVIVIHHFDERHGVLGCGTAIRAPESEALHGFVGNGTDDSSISKIIDQGLPMDRPAAKLLRSTPSDAHTQNFFGKVRAARACRADAMPRIESRRTASASPDEHPGTGPPPAAAGPNIFPLIHPEIGANPHENRSHHQPQTAF